MSDGNNTQPESPNELSSLHTYSQDIAEAVKTAKGSVIKIALAEDARRKQELENSNPGSERNLGLLIGGAVLIIIAIAIMFFALRKKPTPEVAITVPTTPSTLIAYDETQKIETTGYTTDSIIAHVQDAMQHASLDKISVLYFSKTIAGGVAPLSTKEFLNTIGSRAPNSLIGSLNDMFFFGVIGTSTKPVPFIVFKTTSFDNAYAGMLSWETKLFADMSGIFNLSTVDLATLSVKPFTDQIVRNKNARVLKDQNNTVVLFYTFLDDESILITTDSQIIPTVIEHLTPSTIRN